MTITEQAQALTDYMNFRAACEGLKHTLTPAFYAAYIEKGCNEFFGVHVGPDGLVWDEQQPALFAQYKSGPN